jgi:hypothetical protein
MAAISRAPCVACQLARRRRSKTVTIQITGCSGAGKTTIAAVLARRGLAAIDADDDPLLARSVDAAGNVAEEPDFAWLSQHSWAWNPARLDEPARSVPIGAARPAWHRLAE